jgi:hemerythrin superfamily protein
MEHMFKNGILNAFNLFPNKIFKMEKTCMILANELFKILKNMHESWKDKVMNNWKYWNGIVLFIINANQSMQQK